MRASKVGFYLEIVILQNKITFFGEMIKIYKNKIQEFKRIEENIEKRLKYKYKTGIHVRVIIAALILLITLAND